MEREPTPKQKKYIKARLEGKNQKQSAIAAGYSPSALNSTTVIERAVQRTLKEAIGHSGLSTDQFAVDLKFGIEKAKEGGKIFLDNDGNVVEKPDLSALANFLRIVKDVHEPIQNAPTVNFNFAGISEEQLNDLKSKIMNVMAKKLEDKIVVDVEPT